MESKLEAGKKWIVDKLYSVAADLAIAIPLTGEEGSPWWTLNEGNWMLGFAAGSRHHRSIPFSLNDLELVPGNVHWESSLKQRLYDYLKPLHP